MNSVSKWALKTGGITTGGTAFLVGSGLFVAKRLLEAQTLSLVNASRSKDGNIETLYKLPKGHRVVGRDPISLALGRTYEHGSELGPVEIWYDLFMAGLFPAYDSGLPDGYDLTPHTPDVDLTELRLRAKYRLEGFLRGLGA